MFANWAASPRLTVILSPTPASTIVRSARASIAADESSKVTRIPRRASRTAAAPVPHPRSRARSKLTPADAGRNSCRFAKARSARRRPSGVSRYAAYRLASYSKRHSPLTPVFMRPSSEVVPRSSRWLEPRRRPRGSECSGVGRNRVACCCKSPVPDRHPRRAPKLWKRVGSSPSAAPCSCSTMGELAARSPRTVLARDERRENAVPQWDAWELLPWSPHITYPAHRPCAVRERSYLRTDRCPQPEYKLEPILIRGWTARHCTTPALQFLIVLRN